MILFCRKDPQTLVEDFSCLKIEMQKIPFFSPKSRVHPLEKNKTKMRLSEVHIF